MKAQKYGEGEEARVVMCVYWTLRRRLVELAGSVRPGEFGLQRSGTKGGAAEFVRKYCHAPATRVLMCIYWTLWEGLVEVAGWVRPGGFGLQRSKEKDNARGCSA